MPERTSLYRMADVSEDVCVHKEAAPAHSGRVRLEGTVCQCVYSHMHVCCNVCVSLSQRRWSRYTLAAVKGEQAQKSREGDLRGKDACVRQKERGTRARDRSPVDPRTKAPVHPRTDPPYHPIVHIISLIGCSSVLSIRRIRTAYSEQGISISSSLLTCDVRPDCPAAASTLLCPDFCPKGRCPS